MTVKIRIQEQEDKNRDVPINFQLSSLIYCRGYRRRLGVGQDHVYGRADGNAAASISAIARGVDGHGQVFLSGRAPGPRFVSPSSGEDLPDNNHPEFGG